MPRSAVCFKCIWPFCQTFNNFCVDASERVCVCVRNNIVILSFYNSLSSYELSSFGISNFPVDFSFSISRPLLPLHDLSRLALVLPTVTFLLICARTMLYVELDFFRCRKKSSYLRCHVIISQRTRADYFIIFSLSLFWLFGFNLVHSANHSVRLFFLVVE